MIIFITIITTVVIANSIGILIAIIMVLLWL